jgi:hypothetical protein
MRPHLKKAHHKKRAGGVAQDVGPGFKPQYHKKRKSVFPCEKISLEPEQCYAQNPMSARLGDSHL